MTVSVVLAQGQLGRLPHPPQLRSPGASPAGLWLSLEGPGILPGDSASRPCPAGHSLWDLGELASLCGPQCSCLLNGGPGVLPRVMSGTHLLWMAACEVR